MIKLRPGQREVADYRKGYMAVPAVPGAGKTTVLAYLAAELIEKGFVGKGKILIVTYMNSAVSNFRSRIGDFLEERGLPRNRGYDVRTLHSLALNILKEKPEYLLINEDFNIIDPSVRGRLIQELIEMWYRDNDETIIRYFDYSSESPGYQRALDRWKEDDFPRLLKFMISQFKQHGINGKQAEELRKNIEKYTYLNWTLSIYQEYDRRMKYQGLLDFDDLVMEALNLLQRDEQLLERLRGKYSYIFEDEAQDSSQMLAGILSLLAGKKGNLVRVGDSNQAIMSTFASADPGIFRGFTAEKDVDRCSILYSSRSTEDIINLANYLVKWTVNEHPQKECQSALEEQYIYPVGADDPFPNPRTGTYTIACQVYPRSVDEIKGIAQLAARHIKENPENTAAILAPYNYILAEIADKLEGMGVRHENLAGQMKDRLKTIEDFKKVLYYLAEPDRKDFFLEIFREVLYKDSEDDSILSFMEGLIEKYSLEEILYPIGGSARLQEYISSVKETLSEVPADFEKALERLRLWVDASVKLPPDELVLLIAEQMNLGGEELAVAQNIALEIKAQLNANPHWKLHEITEEFPALEDSFLQFASKIYERKGYEPEPGVITLSTIHKSKGLEWDTVYLVYLTGDNFPSTVDDKFRSEYYYLKDEYSNPQALAKAELEKLMESTKDKSPDNVVVEYDPRREANIEFISERLRLFYVAITRARKNLLLSAHQELIFDNGSSKKLDLAEPFIVLAGFVDRERKKEKKK